VGKWQANDRFNQVFLTLLGIAESPFSKHAVMAVQLAISSFKQFLAFGFFFAEFPMYNITNTHSR